MYHTVKAMADKNIIKNPALAQKIHHPSPVQDGVYDITKFVANHPGGKDKIMLAAGKAIDPFWPLSGQSVWGLGLGMGWDDPKNAVV